MSGTWEPGVEKVKGACKGKEKIVEGKAAEREKERERERDISTMGPGSLFQEAQTNLEHSKHQHSSAAVAHGAYLIVVGQQHMCVFF